MFDEIRIKATDAGRRLDTYIQDIVDSTRSQIKKDIQSGLILVNSKKVKAGYLLRENDVIHIEEEKEYVLKGKNLNLTVIYEDEDIAIIDKVAGLVVHPGAGKEEETLVHGLLYRFESLTSLSGDERPGIVHRLDKNTSGLLVIAKTDRAYTGLVQIFKEHKIEKQYLAIVHGKVKSRGIINKPIGRSHKNRTCMAVDVYPSKEAITEFEPIETFNDYSLVRVLIKTGRTHQIRVHMSSIGHSVVGDTVYGHKKAKAKRQLLHSARLAFFHPITKEYLAFTSPMPEDFIDFIRVQGGSYASYT